MMDNFQRNSQLAVILHADIVGSTKLVHRNEAIAHARILETFHRFSDNICSAGGSVRELRGDALLAEFDRASDAVVAALSFQQLHLKYCEALDDDIVPLVRIGVALGEVIIADGTITGAGVVIAQRLEQEALPGGVVVQGAARETIPQRLPLIFESLGALKLKGFDEPIRAHAVQAAAGVDLSREYIGKPADRSVTADGKAQQSPVSRITRRLVVPSILLSIVLLTAVMVYRNSDVSSQKIVIPDTSNLPAVAVLPFDNLGVDSEQQYFAEGIAHDLITDLSKLSGLLVTGRSASFAFQDKTVGTEAIATELGVRYVIQGSVRRANDTLRINAELFDTQTSQTIWSDRYDGTVNNVFAIQDEVSTAIVSALAIKLNAGEERRLLQSHNENFEAYDKVLEALALQGTFTAASSAAAREVFRQAASIQPDYARAHAGIASTHAVDINMNWAQDRQQSIEAGLRAIERATQLDPRSAEASISRANLLLSSLRHDEAIKAALYTVKLAPNSADAHAQLAWQLTNSGRHEEALQTIAYAKRLNPRFTQVYLYVEALAMFHLERYEALLPMLTRAVAMNPSFDRLQLLLAATYAHLEQIEDAEWVVEEMRLLNPALSLQDEEADSVLALQQDRSRYLAGLRLAGLPEASHQ
jgi:adenylate cyclase